MYKDKSSENRRVQRDSMVALLKISPENQIAMLITLYEMQIFL